MNNISSRERNTRAVMALFALVLFSSLFLFYIKSKAQEMITDTIATNMIERQGMIDAALGL